MNPIDELASLLPPAPPSRDLPHRDQHEADLLAVMAADSAPGRLQSLWWRSSWPPSPRNGTAGPRWLAPSAAAIAVACAVVVVAVVAGVFPELSGSGTTPGPRPAGHPTNRHPAVGNNGSPAGPPSGSPLIVTRHWSVPAAAIGTIVASSDEGVVVVTGAATSSASVTAIPAYHGKPPTISSHVSAGVLTVTARCPSGEQNCQVTLQLTVPSREHVVADSGQADVRLAGLSGGGTATAGQGNISLSRVSGGMTAIAAQGNIDANRISGTLTARAAQGDIDVTSLTGQLAAHADQGNITLTGIAGTLTAQADQGSIIATGLAVRQATLSSGQGTINATFSQPPGLVVATCQMGSEWLHLPGSSSYAVTASAQMGSTSVTVPQSPVSRHVVKATSQMGSVTVTR